MDIRNADSSAMVCPNCGTQDENHPFIGYEVQGIYDGVLIWGCQRCKHRWPRFSPPGRLYDYAVLMIAKE